MREEPSVGRRVATGAVWMIGAQWSIRALGLLSTLVLARLLTPDDFGLVALVASMVAVLDAASDFGFNLALIRYQESGRDEYDTAWTLNLIRGVALAATFAALAPTMAGVFDDDRITGVMLILGLSMIIDGATNIGVVDFMKSLTFDREFLLRIVPKIASVVVGIGWAVHFRDYWALVVATLSQRTIYLILSYRMSSYRPRFCLRSWRKLFNFSAWLMGAQMMRAMSERIENFALGGFLTARLVGLYHLGYEVSTMVTTELAAPIRTALFPGLSASSSDMQGIRDLFFRSTEFMVVVGLPLGVGLGLVATEIVPLVLGEQWLEVIPVIQAIAPLLAALIVSGPTQSVLYAMGRTDLMFKIDATQFAVRALVVTSLVAWAGLEGAVVARITTGLIWLTHLLFYGARVLGTPRMDPFRRTWRSFAAVVIMAGAVLGVDTLLGTHWPLFGLLLTKVSIGTAAYLASHSVLWLLAGRPEGVESLLLESISMKWQGARRQDIT